MSQWLRNSSSQMGVGKKREEVNIFANTFALLPGKSLRWSVRPHLSRKTSLCQTVLPQPYCTALHIPPPSPAVPQSIGSANYHTSGDTQIHHFALGKENSKHAEQQGITESSMAGQSKTEVKIQP